MSLVTYSTTSTEISTIDTDVLRSLSRDVDVMAGIGNLSMFTKDGQQRRKAALALRDAADVIDALGALMKEKA